MEYAMEQDVAKAGFDMSEIEMIKLHEIFGELQISTEAEIVRYAEDDEVAHVRGMIRYFKFSDENGNFVVFGNDPFKNIDRYGNKLQFEGFVSYVGIEGSPSFVQKFGGFFYEHAGWKDVSPYSRDFI